MGNEERAEVSKLASIYKLRCRYGKAINLAPSTLIKARYFTLFIQISFHWITLHNR